MMISYIEEVDDENFLSFVVIEKDLEAKDLLRMIMELELLEILLQAKMEAVVKRIFYSDLD